jgi:predicted CopG family antitoxin
LMSVKTVTLSEDAYLALAARKQEGESFSEVVRRLTRTERSLREFVGAWEVVPAKKLAKFEKWMEQSNRSSRTEMLHLGRRHGK